MYFVYDYYNKIKIMAVREKQNLLVELGKPADFYKTILFMRVMYRPHKRASNLRGSSSLELAQSASTWKSVTYPTKWLNLSSPHCKPNLN
jgi:hypothetical protein